MPAMAENLEFPWVISYDNEGWEWLRLGLIYGQCGQEDVPDIWLKQEKSSE